MWQSGGYIAPDGCLQGQSISIVQAVLAACAGLRSERGVCTQEAAGACNDLAWPCQCLCAPGLLLVQAVLACPQLNQGLAEVLGCCRSLAPLRGTTKGACSCTQGSNSSMWSSPQQGQVKVLTSLVICDEAGALLPRQSAGSPSAPSYLLHVHLEIYQVGSLHFPRAHSKARASVVAVSRTDSPTPACAAWSSWRSSLPQRFRAKGRGLIACSRQTAGSPSSPHHLLHGQHGIHQRVHHRVHHARHGVHAHHRIDHCPHAHAHAQAGGRTASAASAIVGAAIEAPAGASYRGCPSGCSLAAGVLDLHTCSSPSGMLKAEL